MAYTDQFTLATTTGFVNRVEVALVKAAIAVMAEAESTVDHSFRRNYASQILADPAGQAAKMTVGVVTDATIAPTAPTGSTATDANIDFAVSSMFTAYARR